jgi:hypothetical protein
MVLSISNDVTKSDSARRTEESSAIALNIIQGINIADNG